MTVHGLLLAAGAGRRMGTPKALVSDEAGPWLPRAMSTLADGGCAAVTVVLGASAEEARAMVEGAEVVVAEDWAEGMAASLRAGLRALSGAADDAALVSLVDLPDIGPDVVRRVLAEEPDGSSLRRASYDGTPGHPVLIGREHWPAIIAGAEGDRGARDYLSTHDHQLVECGDLANGQDVDTR